MATSEKLNLLYRPAIQARSWALVTAHPLSTLAGARMMLAGGNAVDAAVAAAAAVGIVEPFESNFLGGESYILLWKEKEQRLLALEATGYAPQKASLDAYRSIGGIPFYGPKAVIVPGSFDGWAVLLADHGRLRLAETLAPAIELAEAGFPVSTGLNRLMAQFRDELSRMPTSARVFLKDGKPFAVGDLLRQEDLARTLKSLAAIERGKRDRVEGIQAARDWVYRGELAQAWCDYMQADRGFMDCEDLARYKAQYVSPLRSTYRHHDVYTVPPPSQGIALLQALNILEEHDLRGLGLCTPEMVHLTVEALKLAYADRERYIADPDFVSVPTEALLSPRYTKALREKVQPDRALAWPFSNLPSASSTTTLVIADTEGNLLVATTSIGRVGVVGGKTGAVLNNRMRMFHEEPDHPNCVASRKRVRITLNPCITFRSGRPFAALASPGADVQTQAQLQAFVAMVDFGLDAQTAGGIPRWISTAFPDTSVPHPVKGKLILEETFSPEVLKALRAKGHDAVVGRGPGMINIIQATEQGGWLAGADPRREAYALGW